MPPKKISPLKSAQQGVVIIEALIAILVFSIGVLGIVGMQANMVKNTSESKYRADASYVVQQQIGTMWANSDPPTNLDAFIGTINIPALPAGSLTIDKTLTIVDGNGAITGGVFAFTVSWQQPGESAHSFTTTATIAGG